MAGGDHDQHAAARRDHLQSPSKLQYGRRPDHQQHVLVNNASVNNIPADRYVSSARRQGYAATPKQGRYGQEGDADTEVTYIQSDEMPFLQGGQLTGNRFRPQPAAAPQMRRGKYAILLFDY